MRQSLKRTILSIMLGAAGALHAALAQEPKEEPIKQIQLTTRR